MMYMGIGMDKREKNMLIREKLGFLWRMLKGIVLGCIGAFSILTAYIKQEGWMLAVVYAVVAVAAEVTKLLMPEAIANPVVFIATLNMPLSGIGFPILRAVIGYVVSVGCILALTVVSRLLNADIGLGRKHKYTE